MKNKRERGTIEVFRAPRVDLVARVVPMTILSTHNMAILLGYVNLNKNPTIISTKS